jgi:hypothetical protein
MADVINLATQAGIKALFQSSPSSTALHGDLMNFLTEPQLQLKSREFYHKSRGSLHF